mgnify:CR=1 FL=1
MDNLYQNSVVPEFINHSKGGDDLGVYIDSIIVERSVNTPVASAQVIFNPVLETQNSLTQSSTKTINYWLTVFKKNDIISLKINKRHKKHLFLGFIDHIFESVTTNNNSTDRKLVINCSLLLPKLLIKDNIVNAPELSLLKRVQNDPILSKRAKFFGWSRGDELENPPFANKPEVAVKWILENCVATNTTIGNDITAKSFFNTNIKDFNSKSILDFTFLNNEFLFDINLSRYSGNILNYIYSCIDRDFYEVFFDTTSGKDGLAYNKMVLRPKPFSYKELKSDYVDKWTLWEELDVYTINSDIRLNENLGQSDFELRNLFQVYFSKDILGSANGALGKYGYQFPTANFESIKKYGLRDLTVTSRLLNFDGDKVFGKYNEAQTKGEGIAFDDILTTKNGLRDCLIEKRNKIREWYSFPHYQSGQLTVIGGEYDLGKRLFYEDELYADEESGKLYQGVEYYISSIRDIFRYPETYETTFGLTRGAPKDFAAEWIKNNLPNFESINSFEKETQSIPFGLDSIDILNKRRSIFDKLTNVSEIS